MTGPATDRPLRKDAVRNRQRVIDAARDLFGVEEGGELRYGLIEQAQGGTLFLDEIAVLSADLQTRLAAALAARQFTRVGGQDLVPLQARIVSGSSKDLARDRKSTRLNSSH